MLSEDVARFHELLEQLSDDRRPVGEQLLKELVFMSETLDNLKTTIRETGEIDLFKQGKQKFLRENPAMKTYNTTVQRYGLLFRQFTDLLPKGDAGEEKSDLLDFLRQEDA